MTFEQALKAMREGKKIRYKKSDPNAYFYFSGRKIIYCDGFGASKTCPMISSADMVGDDWEIYGDKPNNETIGETTERLSKEYQNAIFESVQIAKNCIQNAEFSEQYKKWENAHKSEDVEHLRADKVVLEHRIETLEKELTEKTAENHELRGQVKAYEHIISMLPWLATYDDDNGGD